MWLIPLVDKRAIRLCDLSLTRDIPERFRDKSLMIKRYINPRFTSLYFTTVLTAASLYRGRSSIWKGGFRPNLTIPHRSTVDIHVQMLVDIVSRTLVEPLIIHSSIFFPNLAKKYRYEKSVICVRKVSVLRVQ